MSDWKTKSLKDLVAEATAKYQEMQNAITISSADYNTIRKDLKSAYWWQYCHPVPGYAGKLLMRYNPVPHPGEMVDPSNQEHQQIARIAGYWVPGRRPGAKNKPKTPTDPKDRGPQHTLNQTPDPTVNNVFVAASDVVVSAVKFSSSVEAISALIDTSSLSRKDIYTVLSCVVKAAINDPRPQQEKQEFQDILDVFMAELEGAE